MSDQFYIKAGDTSPSIEFTLLPPTDLSGASVVFNLRRCSGELVIDRAVAVIADAAAGIVRHDWLAALPGAGAYQAEFEVTYVSGKVETFPNDGYISIRVTDDIA